MQRCSDEPNSALTGDSSLEDCPGIPFGAADRYECERQPQVRPYSQLSWALTPFFQSGSRVLGWSRDIALPLLAATPPLCRLMARTLAGKLGLR